MDVPIGLSLVIFFGGILILLATGMWVGLAMGVVGLFAIICVVNEATIIGEVIWNALSSYVLAAVPLFIFMGEIVLRSGFTARLYNGVTKWTSIVPGGLLHSNIFSAAIFAAISGSSAATAATISTVAYPELEKRNYNKEMVVGSLAAGGTLGPMIPPSIGLIMYGAFCDVPVGKLFIATVIPGIMMAIMYMVYILIRFMLDPSLGPKSEPMRWSYFPKAIGVFKDVWPIFLLIAIIFVGIYGGFMTPTEAAAVSGFVALCLAAAFGKLNFNIIKEASLTTVVTTAMIFVIIVSAKCLAAALGMLMIPKQLCMMVGALALPRLAIWGILFLGLVFLGCLMDATSILFLTIVVLFPLMSSLAFDPLWFGVVFLATLEAGLLTPPVGMCLYIIQGVTKVAFSGVVKGAFPFFLIIVLAVWVVTAFPQLATWLPSTMLTR